jgi:hypothetical protein
MQRVLSCTMQNRQKSYPSHSLGVNI